MSMPTEPFMMHLDESDRCFVSVVSALAGTLAMEPRKVLVLFGMVARDCANHQVEHGVGTPEQIRHDVLALFSAGFDGEPLLQSGHGH